MDATGADTELPFKKSIFQDDVMIGYHDIPYENNFQFSISGTYSFYNDNVTYGTKRVIRIGSWQSKDKYGYYQTNNEINLNDYNIIRFKFSSIVVKTWGTVTVYAGSITKDIVKNGEYKGDNVTVNLDISSIINGTVGVKFASGSKSGEDLDFYLESILLIK